MLIRSRSYEEAPPEMTEEESPEPTESAQPTLLPAGISPKTFMQTVFLSIAVSLTAQLIIERTRKLFAKRP